MIASSVHVRRFDPYAPTGTAWPWEPDGVTVTANVYVTIHAPPSHEAFPQEALWQKRVRQSLAAIRRYRRAARHFVQRVQSVWCRVLYVSRTCAQSERWRVLA